LPTALQIGSAEGEYLAEGAYPSSPTMLEA